MQKQRSDEELTKLYRETMERYNEMFEEGYSNMPCSFGAEEQIAQMEEAMRTGKPICPDYDKDGNPIIY